MTEHWWKFGGALIMALLGLALWFAKMELIDMKDQNKAQWAEAAKTKAEFVEKLADLRQRVSHIEGFHQAENYYNCKEKGK